MAKSQKEPTGEGNLPANLIHSLTAAVTIGDARHAAQLLIDSNTLPEQINSVEKVFVITKYGRELGLDEMTALNSLHIIKGKVTMGYQLMGSLLKKHNYQCNIIKDFTPVEDANGNPILDAKGNPTNYETIIEFKWVPQKYIDLAEKFDKADLVQVFTHIERRTWKEFDTAGYIKNQWKTLPKLMMRIRTFTFGARFIAPEALQNVYETSEIADMGGVNYVVSKEGKVVFEEAVDAIETPEIIIDK